MEPFSPLFTSQYDPLKAGSIDGTDDVAHDRAIVRAMGAKFRPSKNTPGHPEHTVYVGRLNPKTTEQTLQREFQEFGTVQSVQIVRDIVTGFSKCYAFIQFQDGYEARSAVRSGNKMVIDDHEILVDSEKQRSLKGWIPRRLGGGLGGKRESGQLRFGGRDRPFSKPIFRQDDSKSRRDWKTDSRQGGRDRESSSRHSGSRGYSDSRHRNYRKSRSRSRSRERSYHDSRGSSSRYR